MYKYIWSDKYLKYMAREIKEENSCYFPHCDERAVREEYCPVCWEMVKESQEKFDKMKEKGIIQE